MRTKLRALLVVAATAACGDGTIDPRTYTVHDSAGVRIIESSAAAWMPPRIIESEPLLRIGREDEGPYQFAFLVGGLLLEDGGILAVEAGAQEVRIFDAEGRHTRTLGRRGEGPGEIGGIGAVLAYSADTIAVYDGRLRRTTLFDRHSGSHRTIENRVPGNYGVFGRVQGGPLLLFSRGSGFRPDLPAGLQWVVSDVVAMDASDGSFQVIAQLPQREQLVDSDGNTWTVIPGRYSIQAVADDGFYWATPDRYEITFFDAAGVKGRILRRPIEPRPVEQAEVDRHIEALLENVRQREGDAAVPSYRRRYEETSHFGERVPLFGIAFVDRDQRLWVSGPGWPDAEAGLREWTVFSPEGLLLGELGAPPRLRIVDSRDDLVLGIWTDELDVPHIQVHRIVASGSM